MNQYNSTAAARHKARINLEVECEQRDRLERRIEIIDEWLKDKEELING